MIGLQRLDVLIGIAVALLLTWLLLIAVLVIRRPKGKMLQLAAAYRRFDFRGRPEGASDALPGEQKLRLELLVLAVLVILNVVWLGFLLSRAPDVRAEESTSPQSATPGQPSSAGPSPASNPRNGAADEETIQLEYSAYSAEPSQNVRIGGRYFGEADAFLEVQHLEGGKWVLANPYPTKTDESGRFSTYVFFPQPGSYQLRVLDPGTGVKSKTFVLVIKG